MSTEKCHARLRRMALGTSGSCRAVSRAIFLIFVGLFLVLPAAAQATRVPDVDQAVVPVVYPLERAGHTASGCERIRYTFFGNAFFFGCNGLLLTAAHVLEPFPQPDEISVLVPDEKHAAPGGDCWRMIPARVVSRNRDTDLAFLRVESKRLDPSAINSFALAEHAPPVGSTVEMAVFKPARAASWTDGVARIETRRGSITALDRKHMRTGADPIEVYLISTEVAQGESGAPLYDPASGEVVGVVSGISLTDGSKIARESEKPRGAAVSLGYIRSLLPEAGCAKASQ